MLPAAAGEPEGSGAREDAEAAVAELRAAPKPLEVLYNDFAVPSQVCGELIGGLLHGRVVGNHAGGLALWL